MKINNCKIIIESDSLLFKIKIQLRFDIKLENIIEKIGNIKYLTLQIITIYNNL